MMGSLKPHADVHGMFSTEIDVYVKKGALVDKGERGNSSLYCVIVGSTKVQEL